MLMVSVAVMAVLFLVTSGRRHETDPVAWASPQSAQSTSSQALLAFEVHAPAQQPRVESTPQETAPADVRAVHAPSAPRKLTVARSQTRSDTPATPATIVPQAPAAPPIDWQREGEAAVAAVLPKIIQEYKQGCAVGEHPNGPHLVPVPGCPRSSYEGPWRPSGNLVQDLRDPDRPHSSVPGPLPPAFRKAPRSVVRIDADP